MGRPLKIQHYSLGAGDTTTGTTNNYGVPVIVDGAYPIFGSLTAPVYPTADYTTDQYFGVVGGSNTVPGQAANLYGVNWPTVKIRVYITGGSEDDGFIITQKGETKYLVASVSPIASTSIAAGNTYRILTVGNTDWAAIGAPASVVIGDVFYATGTPATGTGTVQLVGVCQLANLADSSLTAGTMTITMDIGDSATTRVSKLTNKYALDWTGGNTYDAASVVQRIRYLANFFDQGDTAIKSGTSGANNSSGQQNILTLAQVNRYDA
jgi:hypothetical protein